MKEKTPKILSKAKIFFVLFLALSFFLNITKTYAETITVSTINATYVYVRTGAGTNYAPIESGSVQLFPGHVVTITSGAIAATNTALDKCPSQSWRKIDLVYDGANYSGYMCADYITTTSYDSTSTDVYVSQWLAAGFPASYIPMLKELKALHPNWVFTADVKTGFTWDNFLDAESASISKNLVNLSNGVKDGWKNLNSYDYNSDSFYDSYSGTPWSAASRDLIAYYTDPRNLLSQGEIFMFEELSYDVNNQTLAGVEAMLSGSFMDAAKSTVDGTLTFAQAFMNAGATAGVSPYFLAALSLQELGFSTPSTIVSGTVSGYENLYNYYNIGATGDNIIANGLATARMRGWTTKYGAILGGAQFIAGSYISVGQDTLYGQKWDIVGEYAAHQYQQNIQAPTTEGYNVYESYTEVGIIDRPFVFKIPVFTGMPATASPLPSTASPINYLSSLTINGNTLSTFSYAVSEYNYYVSNTATTASLSATTKRSSATMSGVGSIPLTGTTTVANIVVTAANGNQRTYKVNFIRSAAVNANIDEIMSNSSLKYDTYYIWGLTPGVDLSVVANKVKTVNASATISIVSASGAAKTNATLGTGDRITVKINEELKTYSALIFGDVSGDGSINAYDLLLVRRDMLNSAKLDRNGSYFQAADVNNNGNIDAQDLLIIKRNTLGSLIPQS